MICYFEPKVKTINLQTPKKGIERFKYDFPYTIVLYAQGRQRKTMVLFSKEKPTEDSYLYVPMLPNTYTSGGLCSGNVKIENIDEKTPMEVHQSMKDLVFNAVYTGHYESFYDPLIKFMEKNGKDAVFSQPEEQWEPVKFDEKRIKLKELIWNLF